jgi:dienelactone hydrolase
MTNSTINRRTFLRDGFAVTCGASAAGFGGTLLKAIGQERSEPSTVNDDIRRALDRAELSMQFQGGTADECRTWHAKFRQKLGQLLGDSKPPAVWKPKLESRVKFGDHTRYEFLLESEGVASLPVYLLVPVGMARMQRVPGVVCVHGHGDYGHHTIVGRTDLEGVEASIRKANYDYGLQFVRRGYVVAAPCLVPFGRRADRDKYGSDACAVTLVRMQALGKLPLTENLRDIRWAIDLLQSRAEVHADRIGCAGLSYGGRMTMVAAAIDDRIKVAAVSGALNLMQERMAGRYSCGGQVIPGLLKYGDYSEIGSLIAPRPCVWEVGSMDGLVVPNWDDKFRERLRRVYSALGSANQLHFDEFEGGHRWNGQVAYPLFHQVLRS